MGFGMRGRFVAALIAGTATLTAVEAFAAARGELAVRAGDTVVGTLRRGDTHVLATELARGDVYRLRIAPASGSDVLVHVDVYGPDGRQIDADARVRYASVSGAVTVGPFTAKLSGTYRIEISATTSWVGAYEARSSVRRVPQRTVRLAKDGVASSVPAAPGAKVTIRGGGSSDAPVAVTLPGESETDLPASNALRSALFGDGLSAPRAGDYAFADPTGAGLRVRVSAPQRTSPAVVQFPELPGTPDAEPSFYDFTGLWQQYADTPAPSAPPAGANGDPAQPPALPAAPAAGGPPSGFGLQLPQLPSWGVTGGLLGGFGAIPPAWDGAWLGNLFGGAQGQSGGSTPPGGAGGQTPPADPPAPPAPPVGDPSQPQDPPPPPPPPPALTPPAPPPGGSFSCPQLGGAFPGGLPGAPGGLPGTPPSSGSGWPGCGVPGGPTGGAGAGGAAGAGGPGGTAGNAFGAPFLGLPPTGIPSSAAVVSQFQLQNATTNPSYVYTVSSTSGPVTGTYTVTVQFFVNGVAVVAPMSFGGNVTIAWTTSGSGSVSTFGTWSESGSWTLAINGQTGAQVLNGSETFTGFSVSSSASATNFTLPTPTSQWPSGTLSSSFAITWLGISEQATQTFNGTNIVVVSGTHAGAAFGPTKIDMTTGQIVP
jgi:hypothetical protein